MALRNQPYIPLYVQDYLTDEKLNMCSLSTQGVYIKIMCIMHKSEKYGTILLKQKDKQNNKQTKNFAFKIAKLLPIPADEIEKALDELIDEEVINLDGDSVFQKRMVQDNALSEIRAKAGKKGGFASQFAKANIQANSENESEYVDKDDNKGNFERKKSSDFELTNIHERIPDYIYEHYTNAQVKERTVLLAKEMTQSEEWMASVARLMNRTPQITLKKVKEFLRMIEVSRECFDTLSGVKKHFSRWVKYNLNETV